jgi:hypothetical protein
MADARRSSLPIQARYLAAPSRSRRRRRDARTPAAHQRGNTLTIDRLDNAPLDAVPIGQLADRIVAFLRTKTRKSDDLTTWRDCNRHALREFWARAPADALGVKQEIEKAMTFEATQGG